jgi:O-acetyl-ADP-ribose deacetylase (regulator of RNase III)
MPAERRVCFVIMPYGEKRAAEGAVIDFDLVYRDVIQEPVEALGLACVRSNEIERAGSIHEEMLEHIATAAVAIVDITTLNANVFYELGVRHALRPGVTVLIRRRGSEIPFNIQGLRVIDYPGESGSYRESRDKIRHFIENGLTGEEPDNPVFALSRRNRDLDDKGGRIVKLEAKAYRLRRQADRRISVLTGDIQERRDIDVWVNSENTNMQMARFYDRGMSALIRYLGARKDASQGILEDTIANELAAVMGGRESVPPGTVYVTGAGALAESHRLKKVFHAAAVVGTPGAGYLPIPDIDRCVMASLRLMDSDEMRGQGLRSIAFPLMGTGTAAGDVRKTAARLIQAAISYLGTNPQSNVHVVHFLAWNHKDLAACLDVLDASDEMQAAGE